jgi:hypothetical protein
MIRGRNQSIMPFLIGHMSRVLVYYFLYQATQIVFAVWFYNRDSPGMLRCALAVSASLRSLCARSFCCIV